MKYSLDALEDETLARADRLVLISPMIGITSFARFAGVAGWPAYFPAFAKAAWLSIVPEFNPFKYNSFPVNGARQSFRLTQALQPRIAAHPRNGLIEGLPPVLTFQSVMDFTVSTAAVISALYAHFRPMAASSSCSTSTGPPSSARFRRSSEAMLGAILPAAPRNFRSTLITNASPTSREVIERATEARRHGRMCAHSASPTPPDIFSLSHVAIPFPPSDGLYGFAPDRPTISESNSARWPRAERSAC